MESRVFSAVDCSSWKKHSNCSRVNQPSVICETAPNYEKHPIITRIKQFLDMYKEWNFQDDGTQVSERGTHKVRVALRNAKIFWSTL